MVCSDLILRDFIVLGISFLGDFIVSLEFTFSEIKL